MSKRISDMFVDDGGVGSLPIIFLHSLAGNTQQWSTQLSHIRKTERAIALDLRGHGQSAPPSDGDYAMDSMAQDVQAIIDQLGIEEFVLVGHSMGGGVATALAGANPHKVAGLLLVDPPGDSTQIPTDEVEKYLTALASEAYADVIEEYWSQILIDSTATTRKQVMQDLHQTPMATVVAIFRELFGYNPVPALKHYSGPTLSLITPLNETPIGLHRLVPDLPHEMMRGASHWLQLDKPDEFNRVMDRFLATVYSNRKQKVQVHAAHAYDSLFVPALFGQWVERIADASQLRAGQNALDVACGTGVLAREMASRVGAQGSIAAVDPNPGMLSVARKNAPGIDWQEGAAEKLPFPDQAFDAVLSQFGLMFFQDRDKSIGEMLRVLKTSGRLAVAVWDAIENIPGYAAELALIKRMAGEAAAEAVRAPFALGDRESLRTLFQEAGAVSIDVTTLSGIARFPSIRTMVEAELLGWLPVMGVELPTDLVDEILQQAETALAAYKTTNGSIVFDVTAHVVSAQKQ